MKDNSINIALNPVAEANRIKTIDILRGIALLGILLMNIPSFSMPEYSSWAYNKNPSDPSFWVSSFVTIIFEGKMRALFSIIFGAGILLFTTNKSTADKTITWLFYRRMFWLVLFGLADAHLLLWFGDILYYYGVIGMIAFVFRKLLPKYLAMATPLVAIVSVILGSWYFYGIHTKRLMYNEAIHLEQKQLPVAKEIQAEKKRWEEFEKKYLPNYGEVNKHTKIMQSTYAAIAAYWRPLVWESQIQYLYLGIADPLGLMLLGMALFKWGFLTGKRSRKTYIKTAWIGYLIGIPMATYNYFHNVYTFDSIEHIKLFVETHWFGWGSLTYEIQRIALVLAHVSVIILLIQANFAQKLTVRLAAVGRMALTNYVMHTVICSSIFFGYGLGYYGHFQYYQLFYVVFAIWIFQLIVSPIWLKHFRFGPLEWLWRSLTYWKLQPFRR